MPPWSGQPRRDAPPSRLPLHASLIAAGVAQSFNSALPAPLLRTAASLGALGSLCQARPIYGPSHGPLVPHTHNLLITGGTGPSALMTLPNTAIHTMGFRVAAPSPWSGIHPNQGSGDYTLYHYRCQRRYAAAPGTTSHHLPAITVVWLAQPINAILLSSWCRPHQTILLGSLGWSATVPDAEGEGLLSLRSAVITLQRADVTCGPQRRAWSSSVHPGGFVHGISPCRKLLSGSFFFWASPSTPIRWAQPSITIRPLG